MTAHAFDPRSLDIASFAKLGGDESGHWPLAALDRLCDEAHADAKPDASQQVAWRATGESRATRSSERLILLHLKCEAQLALVCQRCLQPVTTDLQAQRSFQFAADEAQAAAIDADTEDDVLALTRTLNLIDLTEDELLLALPLVPRHETCPQPLKVRDDGVPFEERVNPFAVLGGLKQKRPVS